MNNVIKLKFPKKTKKPLPRKRVFYIGYRYVGPMFCQDVQHLYLKRKGKRNGTRYWAIIIYVKFDECSAREHSFEIDECKEYELPEVLYSLQMEDEIDLNDLREMGWEGSENPQVEIKSISHPCYNGVIFPDFARPLYRSQFGSKIMAQARAANMKLGGLPLYSTTTFKHSFDEWVWIKLDTYEGNFKIVPVKLTGQLPM